MSKTIFELRRIENNQPEKVVLLNENQMELIFMALSEYQDNIYDEDSPYYSSVDESDFSDLQAKIGEV